MTALTYPALMGGVSGLIIIGLFVGVIPRIKRVFDSMDTALPTITQVVIAISDFFIGRCYIPLVLSIGMVFAFRHWVQTWMDEPAGTAYCSRFPSLGR